MQMLSALAADADAVAQYYTERIGRTSRLLDSALGALNETTLGNAVCDALMFHVANKTALGVADACLFQASLMRSNIPAVST